VQFTNDAYGGTSSTDRNLYVNLIALNGSTVSGASASLYSNGTANFAITTLH
jgi:endoglucanase